jgi:hypothetical protein
MAYFCELLNFYDGAFFNFKMERVKCYYVFVLRRCTIYRLYTTKTFECCRILQRKRTEEDFVEALKIFNSSKSIFQITILLFMEN